MLTSERRRGVLELTDRLQGRPSHESATYERAEDFESFYRRELISTRVLAGVLAGPELAVEVSQETMLIARRRWEDVRCRRSPTVWLRAVCMEQARRVRRRRRREERVLRALGSFRHVRRPRGGDDLLWHAVRTLPESQAGAIAARYALGLPSEDVAVVLGQPEDTVLHEITDARTLLASRQAGDPTTLEQDLRAASEEWRARAVREVDVEGDLEELRLTEVRRRRVRMLAVGAATLLLGVVVAVPIAPGEVEVDGPATHGAPASPVTHSDASGAAGHTGLWRNDLLER